MLTANDLLGVNNITNFDDISLKLYKEFMDNFLCNRIFIYTTEDDNKIKLVFQETNLLHILGAQHILGENYKAKKFNEKILNDKMTFKELERINSIVFNDFTDRFLNYTNLYHVLTNCEVIYFDKDTYDKNRKSTEQSLMNFTYILYKDINNKKIHAGLDTYNNGRSYYCKSLLVKSISNDIFIKEQTPVNIKNIKVIDKSSNNILLDKEISN